MTMTRTDRTHKGREKSKLSKWILVFLVKEKDPPLNYRLLSTCQRTKSATLCRAITLTKFWIGVFVYFPPDQWTYLSQFLSLGFDLRRIFSCFCLLTFFKSKHDKCQSWIFCEILSHGLLCLYDMKGCGTMNACVKRNSEEIHHEGHIWKRSSFVCLVKGV